MNTTSIYKEHEEADAILIAFAEAGPDADLAEWTRRYPGHARALARLAADRWGGISPAAASVKGDPRIVAIGRDIMAAARASAQQPSPSKGMALTSLLTAARARGLDAGAVAERLGLPVAYFWKLHRRLFAPESLPRTLVAELAAAVGRGAEEVADYLRQPPTLALGASYRSDTAPAVGEREDFAATLAADPDLAPVQRARWQAEAGESGEA